MPYHQGLLPQRRQPDDLGGLLDPNIVKRGMLLPLGRTKQGEMEFAVPEILLSLARSARLPGRVAQGYPFKPEDVTEMAMNVAGTGYLGGGLLTGSVPKGPVLGANVWHGGPNRWMPEPGYPQGRPLLSRVGTGEGAQAYGHGFYSADSKAVAKSYKDDLGGFDQLTLHTKAGKKAGDALDDVDLEVAKYLEVGAKDAGQFPHNTVYYAKQNAEKAGDKAALKRLDEYGPDARMSYERNYGSLKKLDLPDEDIAKYLDWDAPLSEQPASVRKALQSFDFPGVVPELKSGMDWAGVGKLRIDVDEIGGKKYFVDTPEGMSIRLNQRDIDLVNGVPGKGKTGNAVYNTLARELGSHEAASEALRKAGIPGLKYYDQMSRVKSNMPWSVKGKTGIPLKNFRTKQEALDFVGGDASQVIPTPNKGTRNYVTWDQDVLNRTKILAQ